MYKAPASACVIDNFCRDCALRAKDAVRIEFSGVKPCPECIVLPLMSLAGLLLGALLRTPSGW